MRKSFDPQEVAEIESMAYKAGGWIMKHRIINFIKDQAALDMDPSLLELVDMIRGVGEND